jgi:hypothetical protein
MKPNDRTLSEVGKMLEEIRDAGLGCLISHPDRTWRLHVWPQKPLPGLSGVDLVLHSRAEVIDCLRLLVLGIRIGRTH